MTEIEWLRVAAWPSFITMVIATYVTTLPMIGPGWWRKINVLAYFGLACLVLFVSFGALWQAHNLQQINSTGFAHFYVWALRLVGMPAGALLIAAGIKTRNQL